MLTSNSTFFPPYILQAPQRVGSQSAGTLQPMSRSPGWDAARGSAPLHTKDNYVCLQWCYKLFRSTKLLFWYCSLDLRHKTSFSFVSFGTSGNKSSHGGTQWSCFSRQSITKSQPTSFTWNNCWTMKLVLLLARKLNTVTSVLNLGRAVPRKGEQVQQVRSDCFVSPASWDVSHQENLARDQVLSKMPP